MRYIKLVKEYFGESLYQECNLDEYNSAIDEHIMFNDRDKKVFDSLFISLPEDKLQDYLIEAQWGGENSYHIESKGIFYPTCDMMDFPPEYKDIIECIHIRKTSTPEKTFYIYKTYDEWYYARLFLWANIPGQNTRYYKCDQIEGLKQYLENEVISEKVSESLESSKLYQVVSTSMNYARDINKVDFTEKDILFLKELGITFDFMKNRKDDGINSKLIHLKQLGKSDKNDIIYQAFCNTSDILLYRDDDDYYYLDFYNYPKQSTTIFKCDTLDGLRQFLTDGNNVSRRYNR
jgi:hypothetical protein